MTHLYTHTHTYLHKHTYLHTHTHTHTYTHLHTHTHTYTHKHTHTNTLTHTHTDVLHSDTHLYTHIHAHAETLTQTHKRFKYLFLGSLIFFAQSWQLWFFFYIVLVGSSHKRFSTKKLFKERSYKCLRFNKCLGTFIASLNAGSQTCSCWGLSRNHFGSNKL